MAILALVSNAEYGYENELYREPYPSVATLGGIEFTPFTSRGISDSLGRVYFRFIHSVG